MPVSDLVYQQQISVMWVKATLTVYKRRADDLGLFEIGRIAVPKNGDTEEAGFEEDVESQT